jgi:hypothetical protein
MYMKAHRHSSDAFILYLSGDGFADLAGRRLPQAATDRLEDRNPVRATDLLVSPAPEYRLGARPPPGDHAHPGQKPRLRFSDQPEVDVDGSGRMEAEIARSGSCGLGAHPSRLTPPLGLLPPAAFRGRDAPGADSGAAWRRL